MNRRPIIAALLALGLAAAGPALAEERMTREAYKAERDRIEAEYNAAKERCDKLSGNAEDVCETQAKADRRIAEANLDARNKGTAKARADARLVRADAQYDVAKQKCDELSGNAKDVCVKDAKAAHARARAEAKADRSADASTATRETDYRAALARCDRLNGDPRATCIAEAKAKYGR
jgi:chromosome segregation ATPase